MASSPGYLVKIFFLELYLRDFWSFTSNLAGITLMLIVTCLQPVSKEIISVFFPTKLLIFLDFQNFLDFVTYPVWLLSLIQFSILAVYFCSFDSMVTTVKPFEKGY